MTAPELMKLFGIYSIFACRVCIQRVFDSEVEDDQDERFDFLVLGRFRDCDVTMQAELKSTVLYIHFHNP